MSSGAKVMRFSVEANLRTKAAFEVFCVPAFSNQTRREEQVAGEEKFFVNKLEPGSNLLANQPGRAGAGR